MLVSVPPQTLMGGQSGCLQVKSREIERQEEAPPEYDAFRTRESILHCTERKPLAVLVVCSVEVRTAGAGRGGRSR